MSRDDRPATQVPEVFTENRNELTQPKRAETVSNTSDLEVKITPEMIAAGAAIVFEHGPDSLCPMPAAWVAEQVYIAMRQAEPPRA